MWEQGLLFVRKARASGAVGNTAANVYMTFVHSPVTEPKPKFYACDVCSLPGPIRISRYSLICRDRENEKKKIYGIQNGNLSERGLSLKTKTKS